MCILRQGDTSALGGVLLANLETTMVLLPNNSYYFIFSLPFVHASILDAHCNHFEQRALFKWILVVTAVLSSMDSLCSTPNTQLIGRFSMLSLVDLSRSVVVLTRTTRSTSNVR